MASFTGEFEVTMDEKGRIQLPVMLRKQIPADSLDTFMINMGFEGCLNLFPYYEWKKEKEVLDQKSLYDDEARAFARFFNFRSAILKMDGQYRLLLPKPLLEEAGIRKDIVLSAFGNRIEVWAAEKYRDAAVLTNERYAELAKKVMVKNQPEQVKED
ncbi:MAG: division/cell wall cluster transcriptional repressor MraZ [Bacteroidetes bacterium]|nr:division/cell wall cluster transcriptional repressor MraZ [Bacteroidota bacterium]